jgi:hypothetical protein
MWSQEKIGYHLKFSITEKSARATLNLEKGSSRAIQLEGPVTETPEPDGKGCSVQVRLSSGVHYVLLQRFTQQCTT